jgi:hypothetical protein
MTMMEAAGRKPCKSGRPGGLNKVTIIAKEQVMMNMVYWLHERHQPLVSYLVRHETLPEEISRKAYQVIPKSQAVATVFAQDAVRRLVKTRPKFSEPSDVLIERL